ncbi:4-hydroxy-tetrahydrodipicolinate reductase [Lactovum odontotermitis]
MKILQIGTGAMGKLLKSELQKSSQVLAFSNAKQLPEEKFDILIDFSHPDNLENIAEYLKKCPAPIVIATTGFNSEEEIIIHQLSQQIPVLYSSNLSLGITLMNQLVKEMAKTLAEDFDIEIIEKHHNKKIDAPSGTAKMLAASINESLENPDYKLIYGRSGIQPRSKNEIGIHSLRAGNIVGEHEVIFAGQDEILSIKHEALSKMIFVRGAIKAANWLKNQENGLYTLENVLFKS